jgi:hypothetical protein
MGEPKLNPVVFPKRTQLAHARSVVDLLIVVDHYRVASKARILHAYYRVESKARILHAQKVLSKRAKHIIPTTGMLLYLFQGTRVPQRLIFVSQLLGHKAQAATIIFRIKQTRAPVPLARPRPTPPITIHDYLQRFHFFPSSHAQFCTGVQKVSYFLTSGL